MTAAASRPPKPTLTRRFADAMAALGPFEPGPHIAIAVSGGADSMALALLARDWGRRRRGRVTALTVDHRLRPESTREARWVHGTLKTRGIAHRILTWRAGPDAGRGNLQAAARAARYRLMADWCRSEGVLHLLTAHHLKDQAETLLLRLGRGSGFYGLAAMAGVAERNEMRLLRPLLGLAPEELKAYLRRACQDWVEDPTNVDPAFARVRVRRSLSRLAGEGATVERIAATARRLGCDRQALEREVARLLAATAAPDPAGFVRLERGPFFAAPEAVGLRALSQVLAAVGGEDYGPRFERLERLYAALRGAGRPRTLGGCVIRPAYGDRFLICREPAAQAGPVAVSRPGALAWDGRFHVRLTAARGAASGEALTLGPLGREGWARIKRDSKGFDHGTGRPARALPAVVRVGLPALSDRKGVLEVPHLGYRRYGAPIASLRIAELWPMAPRPMAGAVFGVAGGPGGRLKDG